MKEHGGTKYFFSIVQFIQTTKLICGILWRNYNSMSRLEIAKQHGDSTGMVQQLLAYPLVI